VYHKLVTQFLALIRVSILIKHKSEIDDADADSGVE